MKTFISKNQRLLFYACWLILALMQAGLTELWDDEAYYWVYSRFLDWGYFDHPPMVALLVKLGYSLFNDELGVRLMFVVLNFLSLVLIEKLTDKKNPGLFYTIALSIAALQLVGFLAVPDTPLIFFTALFFVVYRQLLRRPSFTNAVLLGLVATTLLYSKYHAVLIILFVLLSNFKLFTRYPIYVAGIIALVLFAPHLYWQYQHNWISFRYHLFESNVNPYKLSHTLEYIGGQILLAGPLAGLILLPAAFLYRTRDLFEKAFKFTLAGIYIFFLISSFRGKVEANWTSPALVPLIILSHRFLLERPNWHRWLLRLFPASALLILFARLIMIVDILPVPAIKSRFHAWEGWPQRMRAATHQLPVVFENSYQRASKYWFYSGQLTYSLNWYKERRNNYNFWPIEDSLMGSPVYVLDIHNLDSFQNKMSTGLGMLGYRYDSSFASFAKVQFVSAEKKITVSQNDQNIVLHITAQLPPRYLQYITQHPQLATDIRIGLFDKDGWIKDLPVDKNLQEMVEGPVTLNYSGLALPQGKYYFIFSILHVGTITATHNSEKINLTVP